MKKKIFMRCLIGAPLGLAITNIITVIISLAVGDGNFYATAPELAADCGGELNAVIIQTALSFIYGAAWGGASVIWEKENWSLLRQTLTHLAISSAATLPIAYFTRWMSRSFWGILAYFGIYFAIYSAIWVSTYFSVKKRVKKMNSRLVQNGNEDV